MYNLYRYIPLWRCSGTWRGVAVGWCIYTLFTGWIMVADFYAQYIGLEWLRLGWNHMGNIIIVVIFCCCSYDYIIVLFSKPICAALLPDHRMRTRRPTVHIGLLYVLRCVMNIITLLNDSRLNNCMSLPVTCDLQYYIIFANWWTFFNVYEFM